jgi:plastocyanin
MMQQSQPLTQLPIRHLLLPPTLAPINVQQMSPVVMSYYYGNMGGYGNQRNTSQDSMNTMNAGSYAYPQQYGSQLMTAALLLNAAGVPNDYGQPRWPLALRILQPEQTDPLRAQVAALMQYGAVQAASGSVSPLVLNELRSALGRLRFLLLKDKLEGFGMRLKYDDALAFLDRLDKAEELLRSTTQKEDGARDGYSSPRAEPAGNSSAAMIGVYDNYFGPATITIPVGGTVTWVSYGQHHHTVTGDDGQWGSSHLTTGTGYSHTFAQPGNYYYHCTLHPGQMRGTVVVK